MSHVEIDGSDLRGCRSDDSVDDVDSRSPDGRVVRTVVGGVTVTPDTTAKNHNWKYQLGPVTTTVTLTCQHQLDQTQTEHSAILSSRKPIEPHRIEARLLGNTVLRRGRRRCGRRSGTTRKGRRSVWGSGCLVLVYRDFHSGRGRGRSWRIAVRTVWTAVFVVVFSHVSESALLRITRINLKLENLSHRNRRKRKCALMIIVKAKFRTKNGLAASVLYRNFKISSII